MKAFIIKIVRFFGVLTFCQIKFRVILVFQVAVGHIVPGGAADIDGTLKTGDEILAVDGQRVVNTSHHHVVQLMSTAADNGRVTLHVRRPVTSTGNF